MVVELYIVCCVFFFVELRIENFPSFNVSISIPLSPTKEQLHAMILEVKVDLKEFKVLGHHWSKNDLIICAAEILKWSVNVRRMEGNDGKQFF
jgi:hypothetical protein